jgi:hypothetical protein
MHGAHSDHPAYRLLTAGAAERRTMTVSDPDAFVIEFLENGILCFLPVTGENQIFIEGGNRRQNAVDGRRRKTRGRRLGIGRAESQAQPLNSLVAGDLSQIFQKGQRQCGSEILPGQILTGEKAEEVKQIVSVSRERIRRVTASRQMTQECAGRSHRYAIWRICRLSRTFDEARHCAPLSRTNSGAGLVAVEVLIEIAGEPKSNLMCRAWLCEVNLPHPFLEPS